jgi:hypothetical protein
MDHGYGEGRRRLPGYQNASAAGFAADAAAADTGKRDQGVRTVRRMSNWTVAALVAGVAVTSGYFVHAASVATPGAGQSGSTGSGQPVTTVNGHKVVLKHAVATSGGSGVTAGGTGGSGAAGTGSGGAGWQDN